MKKNLLFAGLLISMITAFSSYAMEEGRACFKCTRPKNDGSADDDVYLDREHTIKETYNNYFCSLPETAQEDDTVKCARVQQPFFIQLCVQASKAVNLDQKPFHELLEKITDGTIDSAANSVMMTKKDQTHRLLSYIPTGKVHSLVNNKKVQILLSAFETEEDTIYNVSMREASHQKHKSEEPSNDEGVLVITRSYRPSFTPKYSGSEITTMFPYDFAADKEHHAKIVAEFNALLKQKNT